MADKTIEAYKAALTAPNGAAVLDDLVSTYVLQSNPYKDPILMARFEGRRDLVLSMLNMLYDNVDSQVDYLMHFKQKELNDGK